MIWVKHKGDYCSEIGRWDSIYVIFPLTGPQHATTNRSPEINFDVSHNNFNFVCI